MNVNSVIITDHMREVAKNLNDYMNQYEEISVIISQKLPKIEDKIDKNIESANELKAMVDSDSMGKKSGIQQELKLFNEELQSVIRTLMESRDLDQDNFRDLKNTIDLSNASIAKIKDIDNISENLKVFAINSIVYAQQAGTQGRGYQFISGQFIRLSEELAKSTRNITGVGEKLNQEISHFLNKIMDHDRFNNEHIELVTKESKGLIESSNKSIFDLVTMLNRLVDHIKGVKEPTYQIMVILQKQDIIHQQMEHILDIFKEMLSILNNSEDILQSNGEGARDILTLMNFLLVTMEKSMIRINGEVLNMITEMDVPINSIFSAIDVVKSDESSMQSSFSGSSSSTHSIIETIFRSPQIVIKNIMDKLRISQEQKADLVMIFKAIEELMKTENRMAKNFTPQMEMIKNLLFLAQVEQARNQLDISLNLDDRNSVFSNYVFEEMDEIISGIDNAHKRVDENLNHIITSFKSQENKYSEIERNLNNSVEFLSKTEQLFSTNFNADIEITNTLYDEVLEYKKLFQSLKGLHDDMSSRIGLCSRIKVEINDKLSEMGGLMNLNDCSYRNTLIKKILDNLTVDEERVTILEEFPELDIEKTVGNTITLF